MLQRGRTHQVVPFIEKIESYSLYIHMLLILETQKEEDICSWKIKIISRNFSSACWNKIGYPRLEKQGPTPIV